jgi:hypothetical protein
MGTELRALDCESFGENDEKVGAASISAGGHELSAMLTHDYSPLDLIGNART